MKYKKGLVSAIMPTYNRCKWIEPRVQELLKQSYEDWELIIVDDGSTDNTQEMGLQLSKDNSNISYIRLEENSGSVTIPRNVGIVESRGEFIAHTDDDVMALPEKFKLLVSELGNGTNNLVYGNRANCFLEDPPKYEYVLPMFNWNPMGNPGWGVDGGQFIYRKSVYEHTDLCFVRRGCDWELAKKIWGLKAGFSYVNEVVSIYIKHVGNRSIGNNDQETKNRKIYPGKYKDYYKDWKIVEEV
jgi:glycosyltransferase involved in cell wall biosynthesis